MKGLLMGAALVFVGTAVMLAQTGTDTRTPAAGLDRMTPSSIASPSSARSTATCWRIHDLPSGTR